MRGNRRAAPRLPGPRSSARGERGGGLARDLEDQLAQDRGLEGGEIGSRDDEGAGTADHVLGVVAVEGHLDRRGRAVGGGGGGPPRRGGRSRRGSGGRS